MRPRLHSLSVFVVLLGLLMVGFRASPAHAAEPGELLINSGGTLQAGQQLPLSFYSGGPANLRLQVSGGDPGNTVRVTLQGGTPASWSARTGETAWGYANLPQRGALVLENTSGKALDYQLKVYALDIAPNFGENGAVFSGVAQSAGIQSAAQMIAPASGLYRFTLAASTGSYQLRVDDNMVLKTVVAGAAPSADDTIYYLPAGVHTLAIIQGTAASTEWSVVVSPVGGQDSLPTTEQTAQLGGNGFFAEERIPIHVAAAQAVNVRIAATGGANDSLTIELYNGADKVFTSSPVFGGEIAWGSSQLATGANTLRVVTKNGNAAALGYAIQVSPVGQTPLAWEGVSYGGSQHNGDGLSQITLIFPNDGLYRFTLGATAGRYQLVLNSSYLRKTVTTAGVEFTAFVSAGAQSLTVVQDPASAQTVWNVAVAPTEQPLDALPFTARSGTLGGAGNAFREEWIPVQVAAGAPVNVRVQATGAAADALQVEVYNGDAKVYTAGNVYGTEVFWGNTALTPGRNLIHIVVPETNAGQMAYEVTLYGVADVPSTWNGVSRGPGMQSTVILNAPVSGVYLVTVTTDSGAGQVQIDPGAAPAKAPTRNTRGTVSTLLVPLAAGPHTFVFQQDTGFEVTSWSVAATLRRADQTLVIATVAPGIVAVGQTPTVTVNGQGFGSDVVVALVGPDGAETAVNAVVASAGQFSFTLPGNLAKGSYGVKVISGGKTELKANAITVGESHVYMPMIVR